MQKVSYFYQRIRYRKFINFMLESNFHLPKKLSILEVSIGFDSVLTLYLSQNEI